MKNLKEKYNENVKKSIGLIIILIVVILLLVSCGNKVINNNIEKSKIKDSIKTNGLKYESYSSRAINGAEEAQTPIITDDGVEFSFILPNSDSEIEYTIKLKNNTDLEKLLKAIKINNPNVTYEIKNIKNGTVGSNSEKEITIVFRPNGNGSDEVIDVKVNLDVDNKTNNNSNTNNTNNNNTNNNNNNTTNNSNNSNTSNNNTSNNSSSSSSQTKKYYTVSFVDDGNTISKKSYVENSTLTAPSVSKKGYTFQYWSLSLNGSKYNLKTPVTSNITLYSVYKINTYEINFYVGDTKKTITKNYGEKINSSELPEIEEKDGKTGAWYIKGTSRKFNMNDPISSGLDLEYKYQTIENEVVFNNDNKLNRVNVEKGKTVTKPNDPSKDGYTFACWSKTKDSCENPFDFNTAIEEAITLYAVYTPNTYTITIKDEDENIIDTIDITYGEKYGDKLKTPENKEGYDFAYYQDDEGNVITKDTIFDKTKEITLTSVYTKHQYTVTYNYEENGGKSATTSSQKVPYQDEIDLSYTAEKEGYTFVGWNISKDSKEKLNSLTMESEDITLYAIFKKVNSVRFHSNGNILKNNDETIPGNSYVDVTCEVYNNETSCNVTIPEINVTGDSIVIGYSTEAEEHKNEINGTTLNINNSNDVYYAQSYIDEKIINVTYTKEEGIESIGKESDSCKIAKVYNGETQADGCEVTLPTITLETGYNSGKWYKDESIYNASTKVKVTSTTTFTAKAVAGTYIIDIKDEDGNIIDTIEVTAGEKYGDKLPTPKDKDGYTFEGYEDEDGNKITADTEVDVTKSIIAKYTKNKYTVTYNYTDNGGSSFSESSNEKEVEFDDNVNLSYTAEKEGYTFIGWNISKDETTKLDSYKMPSDNITLYAIFKKENKLIFGANNNTLTYINPITSNETTVTGDSALEVTCFAYNNKTDCEITVPTISSENTPEIIGYSKGADNYEKKIDNAATIKINSNGYDNNTSYYAQTYKDEITYNITYNKEDSVKEISGNKASDVCTIAKVYNGAIQSRYCEITLPDFEEEEGYENGKWYEGSILHDKNETISDIEENKTYTAKATKKEYTITFKDENENVIDDTQKVEYGDYATAIEGPIKEYYNFKWWSTSKNGDAYNFNTQVKDNLTLYPVYEIQEYTVTIIDQDVTLSSTKVDAGSTLDLPEVSKTGYDLVGWTDQNDNLYTIKSLETMPITLSKEIVNNDGVLTLTSNYKIHKYTITFKENDTIIGDPENPLKKEYLSKLTEDDLPNVSKDGYSHNWYILNEEDPYDLNKEIESDLTLYVRYTKLDNGVKFVDGLNENYVSVEYGQKVDKPEDPSKTGYNFICWSATKDCENNSFDFNTPINKDITGDESNILTLYAVYTAKEVTVTFKNSNDEIVAERQVTYDSTYGELPEIPAKKGHEPKGWYIDNTKIESDTVVKIEDNTTIKPKYDVNSYTVTYDYAENGGQSVTKETDEVDFNEAVDLNVEATKSGYTFIGWNTDKNAEVKIENYTMDDSDVTLYAIFKKENKVTFNANNNTLTYINPTTLNETTVTGENEIDVTCTIYNNETECEITVPTISSETTPTVIGYSDTRSKYENQITSSKIYINKDGYKNIDKYYAQTYKDAITYNVTYTKESSVKEIGKDTDSCTIDEVYNGTAQDTTCKIILPSIVEETGYENGKWYQDETAYEVSAERNISNNEEYVAKASIKKYTVTFKDYNETVLSSELNVEHGTTVTKPSDPTRTHYNFSHWSTSLTGEEYNFNTPITDDLTLYAVYDIKKYTLTFISDGNEFSSESLDAESPITYPDDPTKTGYDFDHWSDTIDGEKYTETILEDDLTLYAVFNKHKYTITFNDEKGTKITDIKVEYQSTIDTSKVPETEKEGYTFDGWFEENSDTAFDFANTQITKNITLTKKYTKMNYGVTFDDEGRTTPVNVDYGEKVSAIESQGKTGYTFSCWSKDKDCSKSFDFNTPINKDITGDESNILTLYAVYTPNTYTITFKNEAGEQIDEPREVTYDSKYGNLPDVPEKTGYTPTGWYIGDDKIDADTKVKITDNTDITPKYSINSYKLIINNNNGTNNIEETLDYNETYTLTKPTKTGYYFNGWTVTGTGSSVSGTTFTMGHEDTTIKAKYEANKYTITLNNNGATNAGTETIYEKYNNGFYSDSELTTEITKITKPSKTGYTFKGYYLSDEEIIDENGNIEVTNTTYTDDVTLTAKWDINSYTLTIDRNDGSTAEVHTLEYNETKSVSDPTRDGYTFGKTIEDTIVKWTLTGEGSSIENGIFTMGPESATLTANWTKNSYQVEYNGNNETSGEMSNSSHEYDESKKLTKNTYSKNGYTFIGWNTDKDATTALYEDEEEVSNLTKVNNDIVKLYAIWSINSYKLTIDLNDSTTTDQNLKAKINIDGEDKTENIELTNLQYNSTKNINNPTKTGYDFNGWTVTGTGSSIENGTFTMGYKDATIKADWKEHIYDINLNAESNLDAGETLISKGNEKIYLKYNDGYYKVKNSNNEVANKMSSTENDIIVPERTGYIFSGYYTADDKQIINETGHFVNEDNTLSNTLTSNITLYAHWERIKASMLSYTDTYGLGCTDVECALNKLYKIFE